MAADETGSELRVRLEQARLELARMHAASGRSLREVWLDLAALVSETLSVDRVSVWVLAEDGQALRCRYLWQRSSHELYQGALLRARDFPTYFEAMRERRTIAAGDACAVPETCELRATYLEPLSITSILDAPIYSRGCVVGVVCHEHVGPVREWDENECGFAAAVADNIARIYEEHQRMHVESALQAHQRHVLELHRLEAIGRMATHIAHDFRGIIGAALGFAELLRRVPHLPDAADQYAARVIDALERGRRLTNEVMKFGKDEPMMPRVLQVRGVIERMATMLDVMLPKSIRLVLDIERAVSRIFMDQSQLERTLLNLALNARDAMPDGGELKITLAETDARNDDDEMATFVTIAVSDTGCGMDEETCANATKPFFTTKGDQGNGLGLAIVEQIMSRSGGQIRLESRLGAGTTARLYIPRIGAATPHESTQLDATRKRNSRAG